MPVSAIAASPRIRRHWNHIMALQRIARSACAHAEPLASADRALETFMGSPGMVIVGGRRLLDEPACAAQLRLMVEMCLGVPAGPHPRRRKRRRGSRSVRFRGHRRTPAAQRSAKRRRKSTPRAPGSRGPASSQS